MPAFSKIEASAQVAAPGDVVPIPPSAFRPTWKERPKGDSQIGLRLVSDGDIELGRARAGRRAFELHPKARSDSADLTVWWEAHNDELMRWIIARGTCDPKNVAKAWSGWAAAPEMMVRDVLTPDGVKLIFDAWERMRIASDPSIRPVLDAEMPDMAEAILGAPAKLAKMEPGHATRIRVLLRYCLRELASTP